MSEEQIILIAAPGFIVSYLVMCMAGVLTGMGRQLPFGLSLHKWCALAALLLVVSLDVAATVGVLIKGSHPAGLLLVAVVSVLWFFMMWAFYIWGANFIARMTEFLKGALQR